MRFPFVDHGYTLLISWLHTVDIIARIFFILEDQNNIKLDAFFILDFVLRLWNPAPTSWDMTSSCHS